jgi:hypothetical protein
MQILKELPVPDKKPLYFFQREGRGRAGGEFKKF